MKPRQTRWLLLALLAAGCGGSGSPQFAAAPPSTAAAFGQCAFCHVTLAVNMVATAGDLKCEVCHADRLPGIFGPGHRSIPGPDQVPSFPGPTHKLGGEAAFDSCAYCHNQFAVNMIPASSDLTCPVCHDQNLLPGTFGPGHRNIPGPDKVPSFAGPTHDLGLLARLGSCAYCHNDLATNVTSSGVDLQCQFCHQNMLSADFGPGHRSIPGPDRVPSFVGASHQLGAEARFDDCAICHNQLAVKAAASSGHGTLSLDCENCHGTDLEPGTVGPMHRNVPRCADCHDQQMTHQDPAAGTTTECVVCHTPHGSTNLYLLNEQILTPSGVSRPVEFTNLLGLADGSFASVSHPGSGVCEICHTTTQFYRSDGSGAQHFPYACFPCHPHADGFRPR
jgi:predicted CXXCH cytochrome family protein